MAIINLRDYYPFYETDLFIEVPDEVELALLDAKRQERNYYRRRFYNKAHFSLDAGDGIENSALFFAMSPCELYERRLTMEQLYAALDALPDKQGRRIYAHYILDLSQAEIAKAEGVAKSRISESIRKGLKNMEEYLKSAL